MSRDVNYKSHAWTAKATPPPDSSWGGSEEQVRDLERTIQATPGARLGRTLATLPWLQRRPRKEVGCSGDI